VVHIVTNGQHQQGNNPRNELRLVEPRPLTPNGVGFPEEKKQKKTKDKKNRRWRCSYRPVMEHWRKFFFSPSHLLDQKKEKEKTQNRPPAAMGQSKKMWR
jgi:hypothetical protein